MTIRWTPFGYYLCENYYTSASTWNAIAGPMSAAEALELAKYLGLIVEASKQ